MNANSQRSYSPHRDEVTRVLHVEIKEDAYDALLWMKSTTGKHLYRLVEEAIDQIYAPQYEAARTKSADNGS